MKELLKEDEGARAQSSAVLRGKETAEDRLKMARQELHFSGSRIQKMELNNMEMSRELKNTPTSFRQLKHNLGACGHTLCEICGDKARTISQ